MMFLEYAVPRVECPEHGVHAAGLPRARHASRFTSEFEDQVACVFGKTFFDTLACRMLTLWHRFPLTSLPDSDWRGPPA